MEFHVGEAIAIGVAGSSGRMGRAVAGALAECVGVEIVARFDRPGPSDADLAVCDVIIDFTNAPASVALAARAAELGRPALVIGSTGFSTEDEAAVSAAAKRIAIVKAGNFSIGVALMASLVERAAARLGAEHWDIEVVEAHHRLKRDAPSGTGLLLAAAAARGRGDPGEGVAMRGRAEGDGPRQEGAIGLTSIRGGGVIGEHAVMFLAEDETLTLSHSARDRRLFARGAIEAAVWIVGREPGLYGIKEILGPE